MRLSRVVMTATVCAVAWAGLGSDPASAQALMQRKVYAAKFLCGEVRPTPGVPPELIPVKPGNYLTAINVHNPTRLPVTLVKKAVLVFNSQQPATGFEIPMPPRQRFALSLGPDWAFEVDCRDIRAVLLGGGPPFPAFIKGWVVFEIFQQGQELDVVAAYTSHGFVTDTAGALVPEGFSTEVETVLGKIVP